MRDPEPCRQARPGRGEIRPGVLELDCGSIRFDLETGELRRSRLSGLDSSSYETRKIVRLRRERFELGHMGLVEYEGPEELMKLLERLAAGERLLGRGRLEQCARGIDTVPAPREPAEGKSDLEFAGGTGFAAFQRGRPPQSGIERWIGDGAGFGQSALCRGDLAVPRRHERMALQCRRRYRSMSR